MSKLSLGTAQLGMDYGVSNSAGKPETDSAKRIVASALAADINFFDTASGYGDSESILGLALKAVSATDRALVVTKISPDPADLDEDEVFHRVEDSLRVIGVRRFLGVLLHRPGAIHDWSVYANMLKRIKRAGITHHVGVSVYDEAEMEQALSTEEVDIIQFPFNIFDQRALAGDWFARARAQGKLLVARSIFLQGLLLLRASELPGHMIFARRALERLADVCAQSGLSAKAACVGFALTHANGAAILFGAESPTQVMETTRLASLWFANPEFPAEIFADLDFHDDQRLVNPSLWPSGEQDE